MINSGDLRQLLEIYDRIDKNKSSVKMLNEKIVAGKAGGKVLVPISETMTEFKEVFIYSTHLRMALDDTEACLKNQAKELEAKILEDANAK